MFTNVNEFLALILYVFEEMPGQFFLVESVYSGCVKMVSTNQNCVDNNQ